MVPPYILEYLKDNDVEAHTLDHPRAVTAQELAATLRLPGRRVAKTVAFEANGEVWLAVLPAHELLDLQRVQRAFGVDNIRLLDESRLGELFRGCEMGAEPPFGRLYGVPVIVDSCFANEDVIAIRAGSHEQCLLMHFDDFAELENPAMANIGATREALAQLHDVPVPHM